MSSDEAIKLTAIIDLGILILLALDVYFTYQMYLKQVGAGH